MSANYTQQKLWQAVKALIGPGHIQEAPQLRSRVTGPARPPHGVPERSGRAKPI